MKTPTRRALERAYAALHGLRQRDVTSSPGAAGFTLFAPGKRPIQGVGRDASDARVALSRVLNAQAFALRESAHATLAKAERALKELGTLPESALGEGYAAGVAAERKQTLAMLALLRAELGEETESDLLDVIEDNVRGSRVGG